MMSPELEYRAGEVRASSPGRLTGYAARFNSETSIGDFTEVIRPGAFAAALASGDTIIALADHDRRALLGSTKAHTLTLREDAQGLAFELTLPDTSHGRDVRALVERGDIRGCSFGFTVPPGGDVWTDRGDGAMLRELRNVRLFEVTVTATPAYGNTELALRSRQHPAGIDARRLWLETV